jgi:tetratricopeptide (TPR) repeat protein
MRVPAIVTALIISGLSADACVNVTQTALDGGAKSGGKISIGLYELKKALSKNLRMDGEQMEAELRGATNFNARSDYTVALMYLGRASEAVSRLEALEKERPGEYFVAANLGTAYELAGNNIEALKWIQEGIRRNPESHDGTEWIHVRILEAKIQQEKDPTYFDRHTVLDLDPADLEASLVRAAEHPEKGIVFKELGQAILHQLVERLQFVKPPDAPVAGLLVDLAMLEAGSRSLEGAVKILKMAKDYGSPGARVDPIIADYEHKIYWREIRTTTPWILGGIGIVVLLMVLYRKGIFVLSVKDLKRPDPNRQQPLA